MSEQVIIALISAGSGIIVALISILINNSTIKLRLDMLEKKQDKHNNLIERVTATERDIKTLFHTKNELNEDIDKLFDEWRRKLP